MEQVIKACNVSKKFELTPNKNAAFEPQFHSNLNKDGWVLKDISFEVKTGEVLGICGRNGTGKSTLLKIMSGIMKPTAGSIMMRGRVGSMLELGAGFAHELSGHENIMMTGALLGMQKKEILPRINDIIEFSGLGPYIESAVKHYSSGMYMRLAFAALTLLDTDILLFDEVMSVGDAEFRIKSSEAISKLVKSGKTIIMTSHNMQELQSLCSRVIWIAEGSVKFNGHPHDVAQEYILDTVGQLDAIKAENGVRQNEPYLGGKEEARYPTRHKWINPEDAPGNEYLRLIEIIVKATDKNMDENIFMQDSIEVQVTFRKTGPCRTLEIALQLFSATHEFILTDSPAMRYEELDYAMPEDIYKVTCIIPAPLLNKGVYWINLAAICNGRERVWQHDRLVVFKVNPRGLNPSHPRFAELKKFEDVTHGTVLPYLKWQMENKEGKVIFSLT